MGAGARFMCPEERETDNRALVRAEDRGAITESETAHGTKGGPYAAEVVTKEPGAHPFKVGTCETVPEDLRTKVIPCRDAALATVRAEVNQALPKEPGVASR